MSVETVEMSSPEGRSRPLGADLVLLYLINRGEFWRECESVDALRGWYRLDRIRKAGRRAWVWNVVGVVLLFMLAGVLLVGVLLWGGMFAFGSVRVMGVESLTQLPGLFAAVVLGAAGTVFAAVAVLMSMTRARERRNHQRVLAYVDVMRHEGLVD